MAKEKEDTKQQQQLEEARQELQRLLAEQGDLDQREREAIQQDHEDRMKAARGGRSIAAPLVRRKSKVQEVKDRAEQLPYLVWSARIRVAELERDSAAERLPEAEAKVEPTRQALVKFEQERLPEVEAEHQRLSAEYEQAWREADS